MLAEVDLDAGAPNRFAQRRGALGVARVLAKAYLCLATPTMKEFRPTG